MGPVAGSQFPKAAEISHRGLETPPRRRSIPSPPGPRDGPGRDPSSRSPLPAGLAGQSGGNGIVAHWTVPSAQRTATPAVFPPSSDAAHLAFGGHALSTAIAAGSSDRAPANASRPISSRSLQSGPAKAPHWTPGSPPSPTVTPKTVQPAKVHSAAATTARAGTRPDILADQLQERRVMALGGRQDPDRAGGVADVEPAPAIHRGDRARRRVPR